MATYSIATTGAPADNRALPLSLVVEDSVALPGSQANAMQTGAQFLCKNPDGSSSWYTYDTERSIPGVSRVLRRV